MISPIVMLIVVAIVWFAGLVCGVWLVMWSHMNRVLRYMDRVMLHAGPRVFRLVFHEERDPALREFRRRWQPVDDETIEMWRVADEKQKRTSKGAN